MTPKEDLLAPQPQSRCQEPIGDEPRITEKDAMRYLVLTYSSENSPLEEKRPTPNTACINNCDFGSECISLNGCVAILGITEKDILTAVGRREFLDDAFSVMRESVVNHSNARPRSVVVPWSCHHNHGLRDRNRESMP